ncbi:MAG: protein kinase, partial [Planctomycetota bacterium]
MVRCKTCRVMLDIYPVQEKKYRCLGCKTVFPGSLYYKYGSPENAPYQSAGSTSTNKPLAQKAKNLGSPKNAEFDEFMDLDLGLGSLEAPETAGAASDLFEDLASTEEEQTEGAQKFVQGATQIQPPLLEGGLSPESLAPYKIKRLMAQGGMGLIYEAIHPQFGRVALKLLPNSEDIEDVDVHRFIREGEVLKNLKHPNIIPFCESGVISKRHYIAMKFQEGMTLDKWLTKRGKFSPQNAVKLAIPLLSALSHAHQQNILHRDLKPENIIVDPNGIPMLMDFGIVKLMGEKETKKITAKGTTVGTPAYMSPEQAQGKNLTPSCDLYSLGAILYELLSGNCPYTGNNAVDVMKNVVHQPLRPLSYHGSFPAEIAWICETVLEKNPEARFQTADEMSSLIQAFLDGKSLIHLKTMVPDRSKFASKTSSKYSGLQKGSRSGSRVSSARSGSSRSGVKRSEVAPKKNNKLLLMMMALFFILLGVGGGVLYTEMQKNTPADTSETMTSTLNNNPNNTKKDPKTDPETRITNLLAQAEETIKNHDPESAGNFYKEVLLADPKNQRALLGRCEVLYAQRYIPQTLNYLETYLTSYRKDWDAHQLKIKCLRENKESQASYEYLFPLIEHLEQMQEIFPERLFQILLMKAEVCEELAQQGNSQYFDQAIQIYQNLRTQQPKDATVFTKLGNLYLRYLSQSDPNTIVECFTQAAQIEPDNPEVQGNLGIAFIFSNRPEEGLPLLEKALSAPKISKEAEANFLFFITQTYFQIAEKLATSENPGSEQELNKRYQLVISYGKRLNVLLIEEKQPTTQVMVMIAQSYFRTGDTRRAKEIYDNAASQYNRQNSKVVKEAPLILEKRAEFYFQRSNMTEAIGQLEAIALIYQQINQFEQKNRI